MLPTMTSHEAAQLDSDVAVLPIGSFEQHGRHLPLSTDTLIAITISERIAQDHALLLLPAVTVGCSHEHATFPGTVSIKATTLYAIVNDMAESLAGSGIERIMIVNGHGGNYVLSNVVQEANTRARRMALFPQSTDWVEARTAAGLRTSNHEDMHGGEAETSLLLHRFPETVHPDFAQADHLVDDRRHLLTVGMRPYAPDGIVGLPSLATAEKGGRLLDAFSRLAKEHLAILRDQ